MRRPFEKRCSSDTLVAVKMWGFCWLLRADLSPYREDKHHPDRNVTGEQKLRILKDWKTFD
jgi:hypothetical protein